MENDLLEEIGEMPFKRQKDKFYTAYSKFLVVNADTMMIAFYSAGIIDLLYPSKGTNQYANVVGSDVFKFLGQHSQNTLSRDYKSRVRNAVRAGNAVSVDLVLCTRRFMGFENFVTHWTPLKTDEGNTAFIVLTLGSMQDSRHIR